MTADIPMDHPAARHLRDEHGWDEGAVREVIDQYPGHRLRQVEVLVLAHQADHMQKGEPKHAIQARGEGDGRDTRACPNCEQQTRNLPVARQAAMDTSEVFPGATPDRQQIGVADVGFRCEHCGHRWGFEKLTDEWIAAGGRLTNESPPRETTTPGAFEAQGHIHLRVDEEQEP